MLKKGFASVALALVYALAYVMPLAFLLFFLEKTNFQVLTLSRTSVIMSTSFVILMYVFSRIYGGFRIGQQKSRPIIYQMSLAVLFTDIILYLQLQIMNVNEANNDTLELFTVDLLLLAAALVLQIVFIIALTYLGNYIYFSVRPPKKCCVITANKKDMRAICNKVGIFRKQLIINECVECTDPDLHAKIKANETIILFHLPAKVHQELIAYCYKCQKDIYYDLSVPDVLTQKSGSFLLDDVMMTAHTRYGLSPFDRFLKRTLDLVLSSVGLIVLSPLMLIVAIAIKLDDGGSIFYRQDRMTRGDQVFRIYKFRTMREDAGAKEYSVVQDDDRITRVGAFLRKYRIDELPQLINILKGEMSVVGPRPEMLTNFNKYLEDLPEYAYRCQVKAGLTGYAQISGKYNTTPRDKLMMDISYIEGYSFWLDIKLILKTLTVFFRHDSTEAFESAPADDPEEQPDD
ncbi:MAG: sugar transferase [Clostridia bacterium]|nr:sugar transferase [Clostridia bacterium]